MKPSRLARRFFIYTHYLKFAARQLLLSNEQEDEECDATDDDQGTEAGITKKKKL